MSDTNTSSNPSYLAAIGDMVGSRTVENRSAVQERTQSAIEQANENFDDDLVVPIRLTGGDEWKVLVRTPWNVVDVIDRMADALYPVQTRWGMGWGELQTPLDRDVGALDGACFHHARTAIEKAAKERAWVQVTGFSRMHDEVLSALFGVLGALRDSWSDDQMKYIRATRGRTQKEAAGELGITQSGISKGLGRAHYTEYQKGLEAARTVLGNYRGESGP